MKVNPLKDVTGFEWDKSNIAHIGKHSVTTEEAEDIFFDSKYVLNDDIQHSVAEKRFVIIGKAENGRLLYQIFTIRESKIRVISSRDINRREVKLYEKATNRSKV